MKDAPLLNFALAIFIALSIGWLLFAGRAIILPLVAAVISVYIILSAADGLKRLPLFRHVPDMFLRLVVLVIFSATIVSLAILTAATVREIADVAPQYEANLDMFMDGAAARFGLDREEIWRELRAVTIEAFDLRAIIIGLLGGFTNVSATIVLIVIYAAFLIGERKAFRSKVLAAFPSGQDGPMALNLIREINSRVSNYLVAKTLINLLLGIVCYLILRLHGVDFALFWAVVIALFNYIPYVGSYLGVLFPVVLSLAQFVSLPLTLSLGFFLTIAQFIVGTVIEPRAIGRQVNLSPMVVLVALSFWTALWGIPGAILAVPMTSVMAIILAGFPSTRFIAQLLADEVIE